MRMKYKSSEPYKLAIEVQFSLFVQQVITEYLPRSSVCYNVELQEMVPARELAGRASQQL